MRKKLVLFTSSFPFGKGETFIESELPIIADFFETIIVQPMTYGGDCFMRATPGNVVVRSPVLPKNRYAKLFFSMLSLFKYKDLRKEFLKHRVFLSLQRFYDYLLTVSAKRYFYKRLNVLLPDCTGACLYFYWGIGAAYFVPELKSLTAAHTVMRLHGGDLYEDVNQNYIPLREKVYLNTDVICPVSEFGSRYLIEKYPHVKERVVVSRLGTKDCGSAMFMPDIQKIVLVSCALLFSMKRIHLLAQLLNKYTAKRVVWHHFGDGPEYENVKKIALNAPNNINSIFHGQVSNKTVLDFYRDNHIDAFISVSSYEGIPVSIMEAMSFGIPVIATDVGGTAEILCPEGSVLLSREFSKDAFYEALSTVQHLGQSADVRERIRRHWRSTASAESNYKSFAEDILIDQGAPR